MKFLEPETGSYRDFLPIQRPKEVATKRETSTFANDLHISRFNALQTGKCTNVSNTNFDVCEGFRYQKPNLS